MIYNGIASEKTDGFILGTGEYEIASAARAVDLGFSAKWADRNLGATAPEAYGGYYAWGEIVAKNDYSWSTYKWYNNSTRTLTKYIDFRDESTRILFSSDDAARVDWGGNWRMPTLEEYRELFDKCTFTMQTQKGVRGCLVTGPNGNNIFLPASGRVVGSGFFDGKGFNYSYWMNVASPSVEGRNARRFYNNDNNIFLKNDASRSTGMPIRPVVE